MNLYQCHVRFANEGDFDILLVEAEGPKDAACVAHQSFPKTRSVDVSQVLLRNCVGVPRLSGKKRFVIKEIITATLVEQEGVFV
jgi:hypothetical protein